jgi:hypothetical protein
MRDFSLRERWQPTGACWAQAAVHAGSCANVLRDKRKLALAFTNCHLQESGRPLAPEPHAMSDATFAIYTEFFTHTSDLCFHLQGEHHQQRANEALRQLAGHAHDWLHLVDWARAIAGFLAGVVAIWIVGKGAKMLEIPHADRGIKVAHAMHLVVHALGTELALVVVVLAGVQFNS